MTNIRYGSPIELSWTAKDNFVFEPLVSHFKKTISPFPSHVWNESHISIKENKSNERKALLLKWQQHSELEQSTEKCRQINSIHQFWYFELLHTFFDLEHLYIINLFQVHSSHSYSESHRENFDYGTNTAIFITVTFTFYNFDVMKTKIFFSHFSTFWVLMK